MKRFFVYTILLILTANISRANDTGTSDISAALSNAATSQLPAEDAPATKVVLSNNTPEAPVTEMPDATAAANANGPEGFGTDARDNEIWVTAKTTKTDLDIMRHYVSANNKDNAVQYILNAILLLIVSAAALIVIIYVKKRRGLSYL